MDISVLSFKRKINNHLRYRSESAFFGFIRKNFFQLGFLSSLPYAFLAIYIHIYYHYNQGARFIKDPLPSDYVFHFPENFEELNFKTKDNALINAVLFKAPVPRPKGVIYYFHGNGGNASTSLRYARLFFPYGYDFLVWDNRGCGKSVGPSSEQAFYDDAQMIYDELKKRYNENSIYIVGHSLQCAVAANVASRNNPAALIMVGPLYSFADAQKNCPWYYPKVTEYTFRTDLFVQKTKCPIYIFSGTSDMIHEASVRLSKLLKKNDKLYNIKGANHTDIFFKYEEFRSRIKEILNSDNTIQALVVNY